VWSRFKEIFLEIRVGYELIYDCPQQTPMMLVLHIHYSRASDIIVPDHVTTTPSLPMSAYRDGFGNWCTRLVAPAGSLRIASAALVRDTGEPDIVAPYAQQHSIQELPEESLVFLLGSRYCDTEKLAEVAWNLFGHTPMGWGRVQAICDFVHNHISFGYEHARATRTAFEAYNERRGVCRDYAHLAAVRVRSGRPMIVLVAPRGPCVATGTGRATRNCNGSIGARGAPVAWVSFHEHSKARACPSRHRASPSHRCAPGSRLSNRST
jgi:Transglutaminase-like superfamily